MADTTFVAALTQARKELSELRRQRQQIDLDIAKISQVIAALKPVAEPDDDDADQVGLTDSVRSVLRVADTSLLPTEVRDRLVASGFDTDGYNQFMPAVHTVLKRLCKSGETMELDTADGTRYWWSLNGKPPAMIDAVAGTVAASMDAANMAVQANYAQRRKAHIASQTSQPLGTPQTILDEVVGTPPPNPSTPARRRLSSVGEPPPEPPKTGMQKILGDSQMRRRRLLGKDE